MRSARILASTLVAASLVTAPIVAQAAAPARLGSDVRGENIHGGWVIPILALAAVILGIIVLVSDDNEDLPHSP